MSETVDFATARRGLDAVRVGELLERGIPVQAVARMTGSNMTDVQGLRDRLMIQAPDRAHYRRVLSIWRGEILLKLSIEWKDIVRGVAERHGLTLEDLIGDRRTRNVAYPRHEAMWALYETGRYTTTQIGRWFGRDHSSVCYAIREHQKRIDGQ